MALRINDTAPDFTAETTEGPISFHEWIGDGYAVLFSHPKDFTPVCTTELGVMAGMVDEFAKRNTKIIGISVDPVEDHHSWKADIQTVSGNAVGYPMIGDPDMTVAKLYDMLPAERAEQHLESGVVEVAPLAFMRGRTLNDAFIILDEAQNTTGEQMKMFLTRMGFGSTVVVTGDVTQTDLPITVDSGLRVAQKILANIDGISFVAFDKGDVVRHPLVARIIRAYEQAD